MPTTIHVGRRSYSSTNFKHAEELMVESGRHLGSIEADMNAWPCTGERGHDCHELLRRQSVGRTITLTITDDHGGYAANHGKPFGTTGEITYDDGTVKYG